VDDRQAKERVVRVEDLLDEIDALDEAAGATALAAVRALLDLYGEGLARIVDRVAVVDGGRLAASLADDELVSHLLMLHDLHPETVEQRIGRALDEVRPYLGSHGGDVELLYVEGPVAHLRLQGSCSGCPSSAVTLRLAVEDAIRRSAPEIERIEAEGVAEAPAGFVPLDSVRRTPTRDARPPQDGGSWAVAGALTQLAAGGTVLREVSGEPVLFISIAGALLAYRDGCPACDASLADGALDAHGMGCPGCGHLYDVRRGGRCLDDLALHLQPIPLLTSEAGIVSVALPAPAA
jgi:Fe-S cluster biogenesis protein NfuA/nitrite reductase/ring-hydroxylating ferredoxin subunit